MCVHADDVLGVVCYCTITVSWQKLTDTVSGVEQCVLLMWMLGEEPTRGRESVLESDNSRLLLSSKDT